MKVYIVDDEPKICQWFSYILKKNGNHDITVKHAHNGREGLGLLNEEEPDILITDITMPLMNGLELMAEAKMRFPRLEVLILSCHADFKYAQQAVKQGAYDYILKSEVKEAEIIEVINELKYRKTIQLLHSNQDVSQKRSEWLTRIVRQAPDATEEVLFERLEFRFDQHYLFALSVWSDEADGAVQQLKQLGGLLERVKYINRIDLDEQTVVLFGNFKHVNSALDTKQWLLQMAEFMKNGRDVCSIGLSEIRHGSVAIPQILMEALISSRRSFYSGSGIYQYAEQDIKGQMKSTFMKHKSKVWESLNRLDTESAGKEILNMIGMLESTQYEDVDGIKATFTEMIAFLQKQRSVDPADISMIMHFDDFKRDASGFIADVLGQCNLQSVHPMIRQAVALMNEHYQQKISLLSISKSVHLNPTYFSELFKRETGEHFNTYLTSVRIKKAAELLSSSDLKIYEVAEQVGFSNMSYFSKKFKDVMGVTPFEYRN